MNGAGARPVVSVIIPAFNEADRVAETVAAALRLQHADEVIVVDDGSTDGTADQVCGMDGVTLLALPQNRGKGAAVNSGVEASRGEILLLLDADLGSSAANADPLVEPVADGQADLTIAVLPAAERKGGFGFVLRTAAWGIRKCSGFQAQAPLSGQRAIRKDLFRKLHGAAGGFAVEIAMTIDAVRAGARVQEVEVSFRHRETGRDVAGFRHRFQQWRHVVRALLPRLLRRGGRLAL